MSTTTTPVQCDCLVFCGDDPWLNDGRSYPCQKLREQQQQEAEATRRREARMVLYKQYNTTNIEDLVDAQALHISQLQARLEAA